MADAIAGEDGLRRCSWALSTPDYVAYHDDEWGRPVNDDQRIYEKLCLEGFQAGLSWLTILRKREGFRRAFASFDPAVVATFTAADIKRLLNDEAIVRHRAKIEATISNARATVALWDQGRTLGGLVWRGQRPKARSPRRLTEIPSSTPESKALSAELRRLGFKFLGPTTVYAAMQALGVVNDHVDGCHWRKIVEQERATFAVPTEPEPAD